MSFGTDIRLSSNAVNQALGQSKAVAKNFAAGGFDHDEAWNPLDVPYSSHSHLEHWHRSSLRGPKNRELPDHQGSLHSLMAGFLRTMNTAEVT